MVGRDPELRRLRDAAATVRAGEAATVLVLGEAGIGKSRLAAELTERLTEEGWLVVAGHGVELGGGEVPFGVLTETLRGLVRELGLDAVREVLGPERDAFASLLPQLADAPATEPQRGWIIGATGDLLAALAAERPVCWLIEDLPWLDASTRDLVAYVVRSVRDVPLLVLATIRTGPGSVLPSDIAELARAPGVESVELGRLPAAVVAEQLALLPVRLEPGERQQVVDLSDGVPFFVEELAGSWTPGAGAPPYRTRLVLDRLAGLSGAARDLADAAAVGDGLLTPALLGRLGFGQAEVREAAAAGVVEPMPSSSRIRFCHALLREAVLDSMLPGDRQRWHRAWAEAIETDEGAVPPPVRPSVLAQHWAGADEPEQALRWSAEAARAAYRSSAPDEELVHLRRVLDLWDRVADPVQVSGWTIDVVTAFAWDAASLSSVPGAREAILGLELERARARGDAPGVLALGAMAEGVADLGEFETLSVAVAQLIEGPADARAVKVFDCAVEGLPDQELVGLDDCAWRMVAEIGEPRLRRHALRLSAGVAAKRGDLEAAVAAMLDERVELRRRPAADRWTVAVDLAYYLVLLGRSREAVEHVEEELRALHRPEAFLLAYRFLSENLAGALVALGRWDEACVVVERALRLGEFVPVGSRQEGARIATWLAGHRADVELARGRALDQDYLADARRIFDETWADAEINGESAAQFTVLLTRRGDLAGVRDLLAGAWEPELPARHAVGLPHVVLAALRAESELVDPGDAEARRASRQVADRVLRVAARAPRAGPRGAAGWAEAQAHAARAQGSDTPQQWAEAVAHWRVCEQPYDVAQCLRWQAEAHLRGGDPEAATAAVVEALEIAEGLGARPLAESLRALARRGRLQVAGTSRTAGPLTTRECEVLALVAQGQTNEQVAAALYLSPKTVSVHVSRILTKLDATNRTHAVAIGRRQGLIDQP